MCLRVPRTRLAQYALDPAHGAGLSLAGVLVLLDRCFAAIAMGTLLTILIAVYGLGSVALGVSSRPLQRGLAHLGAGLFMLTLAILLAIRWPTSGDAALALWVGLALIAGGRLDS
jgi:uncharacterized membrane protein HdeD (DUF308 family)